MNVTIFCLVSLSKKLEKLCQDELFLSVQTLDGGKGLGKLRINCPDNIDLDKVKKIKDLNISLKIDSISEDVKEIGKITPVQNLYSDNVGDVGDVGENIENNKLAITDANAEAQGYKNASQYPESKNKPNKQELNFISNYNDLIKIISAIKDIDKELPQPPNKKMTRAESVEWGKNLQSIPKLPLGVYISNELGSKLCINDLDLSLLPSEIYDISKILAKKIKNSSHLKMCFERNYIKFRSRGEYDIWCGRITEFDDEKKIKTGAELEVFSLKGALAHSDGEKADVKEEIISNPSKLTNGKGIKIVGTRGSDDKILIDLDGENYDQENTPTLDGDYIPENQEIDVLIKTLPEVNDNEMDIERDIKEGVEKKDIKISANTSEKPLLSDEVENSEKKKIKRVS